MWIEPVVLRGREIRLEPLEARHAADLFAAADPELFRHTPQAPGEWSVAGFSADIERVTRLAGVVAFAIVLDGAGRDGGRAIGRTTYMEIRPDDRGVEIERTWIGRAWHGTRVNPEAKYLMLEHAFERLEPRAIRVQFTTGGTNMHSQRAIEKLGALREGVLRKCRVVPGFAGAPAYTRDTVYYSVLAEEWAGEDGVKARLARRLGW